MTDWKKNTEAMVLQGRIKVPYTWWVGETGTTFFDAIKETRTILGTHCPKCDLVFVPPRKTCGRCLNTDMAWRKLSNQGTVITYTQPRYQSQVQPTSHPFAYALIKLDGADTSLCHIIKGFAAGELKVGLRVEATFKEDPQGGVLDIAYFKPISAQG